MVISMKFLPAQVVPLGLAFIESDSIAVFYNSDPGLFCVLQACQFSPAHPS